MRLALVAILSIAAGVVAAKPAPAQAPAPFDGAWMSCESWQGSEICEYTLLAQRDDRVCGLQRYFATNAYYEQRFVGTVKENVAHIEKICGDPGSETDTYCAGRAPSGAAKTGWQAIDRTLGLCNGQLFGGRAGFHTCAGASRRSGVPKVDDLGGQGPEPEERAWLLSCVAGTE